MDTPLATTYFGHRISIEPDTAAGFLAHITDDRTGKRLIASNSSELKALEDAFDMVDDSLEGP